MGRLLPAIYTWMAHTIKLPLDLSLPIRLKILLTLHAQALWPALHLFHINHIVALYG